MDGVSDLPAGHSTPDSLRILHDELKEVIKAYEISWNHRSMKQKIRGSFLHHENHMSVFHWTSASLLIFLALLCCITYYLQEDR